MFITVKNGWYAINSAHIAEIEFRDEKEWKVTLSNGTVYLLDPPDIEKVKEALNI